MKRLHAVVEGHGEVEAVPALLFRVLDHLGRTSAWVVNRQVARLPRSLLVDQSVPGPERPPRPDGLEKAIGLALANKADALVVLVDADDDCPASFGPPGTEIVERRIAGAAVMAVREFETWLLLTFPDSRLRAKAIHAPEAKRDAKGALRRLVPGYAPTTHQVEVVRRVDVARLRRRSMSFDKLVRDVEVMTR